MNTSIIDPLSPKSYKDLVGNAKDYTRWASIVASGRTTHVLWVGPVGIGKSSFWKLVIPKNQLLVINCYSDAGLREQRDSIKHFIRLSSGTGEISSRGKTVRYILFEHAEVLSDDAQAFLRRMLEVYSSSIFCIFEVRDATAITDPISSRCQIVQLSPLASYEIEYELKRRIPSLDKKRIQLIAKYANGNIRWALLQGFGSSIGFTNQELGFLPPDLSFNSPLKKIVEWESRIRDEGYDPRVCLIHVLPQSNMELWHRIMETPGGVHTRSQTILMAIEGRGDLSGKEANK
jgi:replication factor C subunit 3/5